MNTTKNIATYLSISLACLMLVSQAAYAEVAGYAQFVNGSVQIISVAGQTRTLQKGEAVNEGDTVISAKAASAQIKMQDGGFVAMRPDTSLKFDSFKFNGKEDGSERSFFSLFKGGFRAVTGLIGRVNKTNYRITTASSTIGIRGTDHETFVVTPDSSLANAVPVGTYNKVNIGETVMTTDKGTIFVLPNQMGFAGAADQMPELKPLNTDIFTVADRPTKEAKGDKKEGKEEVKEVRENATVDNTAKAEEGAAHAAEIASSTGEGIDTNTGGRIETNILQPITTTDGIDLTGGGEEPASAALAAAQAQTAATAAATAASLAATNNAMLAAVAQVSTAPATTAIGTATTNIGTVTTAVTAATALTPANATTAAANATAALAAATTASTQATAAQNALTTNSAFADTTAAPANTATQSANTSLQTANTTVQTAAGTVTAQNTALATAQGSASTALTSANTNLSAANTNLTTANAQNAAIVTAQGSTATQVTVAQTAAANAQAAATAAQAAATLAASLKAAGDLIGAQAQLVIAQQQLAIAQTEQANAQAAQTNVAAQLANAQTAQTAASTAVTVATNAATTAATDAGTASTQATAATTASTNATAALTASSTNLATVNTNAATVATNALIAAYNNPAVVGNFAGHMVMPVATTGGYNLGEAPNNAPQLNTKFVLDGVCNADLTCNNLVEARNMSFKTSDLQSSTGVSPLIASADITWSGGTGADAFMLSDHSIYMGRWVNPTVTVTDLSNSAVTTYNPADSLWAVLLPPPAGYVQILVGTTTYTMAGHTTPFDSLGNLGTLNSATLNADFTNQLVNAAVNLTMPAASSMAGTYAVTASNMPINTALSGDSSGFGGNTTPTVSCSGTCTAGTGSYSASVGGSFAGTGAASAGMAYNIWPTVATTGPVSDLVQGLVAFNTATAPTVAPFAAYAQTAATAAATAASLAATNNAMLAAVAQVSTAPATTAIGTATTNIGTVTTAVTAATALTPANATTAAANATAALAAATTASTQATAAQNALTTNSAFADTTAAPANTATQSANTSLQTANTTVQTAAGTVTAQNTALTTAQGSASTALTSANTNLSAANTNLTMANTQNAAIVTAQGSTATQLTAAQTAAANAQTAATTAQAAATMAASLKAAGDLIGAQAQLVIAQQQLVIAQTEQANAQAAQTAVAAQLANAQTAQTAAGTAVTSASTAAATAATDAGTASTQATAATTASTNATAALTASSTNLATVNTNAATVATNAPIAAYNNPAVAGNFTGHTMMSVGTTGGYNLGEEHNNPPQANTTFVLDGSGNMVEARNMSFQTFDLQSATGVTPLIASADITWSIGTAADTFKLADNSIYAGRWVNPTVTVTDLSNSAVTTYNPADSLWAVLLPPPAGYVQILVGTTTYTMAGHTTPFDSLGNLGTLNSATFNADFTNQLVNAAVNLTMGAASPMAGTFAVTGTSMPIQVSGFNSGLLAAACTGTCANNATGYSANLGGSFAGAGAASAGLAYNIWPTVATTVPVSDLVQGLVAFTADTTPTVGTGGPFAAYNSNHIAVETAGDLNFFNFNSGMMATPADLVYVTGGAGNVSTSGALSSMTFRDIGGGVNWIQTSTITGGTATSADAPAYATTGIQYGAWTGYTGQSMTTSQSLGGKNGGVPSSWMYGPEGYLDAAYLPISISLSGAMAGSFSYQLDGATAPKSQNTGLTGTLTSATITADFVNMLVSANLALIMPGNENWAASMTAQPIGGSNFGSGGGLSVSYGLGVTPTLCATCGGNLNGMFTGQNYAGAILSYNLYSNFTNSGDNLQGEVALSRNYSGNTNPVVANGPVAPTGNIVVANGNNSVSTYPATSSTTSGNLLTAYGSSGVGFSNSTTVTCTTCSTNPSGQVATSGIYYGTWDTGSYAQSFSSTFTVGTLPPAYWITGPEAGPLYLPQALTGTASYTFNAGQVSNFAGVAGTVTGTTALTLDFNKQTVGINLDVSIADTAATPVVHAWNAQTLPGNEAVLGNGQGVSGAAFSASTFNNGGGSGLLTVAVDGSTANVTNASGNINGQLTGSGLTGAIMSFNLGGILNAATAPTYENINGVAAFTGTAANTATPYQYVSIALADPFSPVPLPVLGFYANAPSRVTTDASGNLTQFDTQIINNNGGGSSSTVTNVSATNAADHGTDPVSGISWGRWAGGTFNVTDRATSAVTLVTQTGSLHWITEPVSTSAVTLPTSGTYTYINAGGTLPTDNLGNVGTLNSATLSANFTAQTVNVGVNATVAGATLNAAGNSVPIIQQTVFYASSQEPAASTSHLAVTCTAGTCGATGGTIVGKFTGAGAIGAAMTYGLQNGATTISGVTAFHR